MEELKLEKIKNGFLVFFGKETYCFQSKIELFTFIGDAIEEAEKLENPDRVDWRHGV